MIKWTQITTLVHHFVTLQHVIFQNITYGFVIQYPFYFFFVGGILDSLSDSVRAVVIVDAAHHLDMMASNPSDPEPVKMARNIHKEHIRKWIRQFREQRATTRKT